MMLFRNINVLNSHKMCDTFFLIICRCWKVLNRDETWPRNKVFIHLCSSHIIKSITNRLAGLTSSKKLKKFCTFIFARMINSTSKNEVAKLFSKLCTLLLKEKFGDDQEVLFFR